MIWNFGDPIPYNPTTEELEAISRGLEAEFNRVRALRPPVFVAFRPMVPVPRELLEVPPVARELDRRVILQACARTQARIEAMIGAHYGKTPAAIVG